MSDDPQPAGNRLQEPELHQALDRLELLLGEVSRAIVELRRSLAGADEGRPPVRAPAQDLAAPAQAPAEEQDRLSVFDRLLERLDRERSEKLAEAGSTRSAPPRGFDLLPRPYLMTVEDREGNVDLVPLHRALASLPAVDEAALASYTNGVPVVSLRVTGELDLAELSGAVSTAMDRQCEVIPQENDRLYLRLSPREA